MVTVPIDPQGSPLLTASHHRLCLNSHKNDRTWQWPIWQHVIFGDESRFQLYPVDGRFRLCNFLGEHFQQRCQVYWVQAGGGSVHDYGAFHSSAKSSVLLPDRYLTSELYRGILRNTLVPFCRQHIGDNFRHEDDNDTPHSARVVLDFHQLVNVTKMEQPARSPDCKYVYWFDEIELLIDIQKKKMTNFISGFRFWSITMLLWKVCWRHPELLWATVSSCSVRNTWASDAL